MNKLDEQKMIDSFSRISFYGERRGAQDFIYYTKLLKDDLESLGDTTGNYETKFVDKVMSFFYKQSNCTSSFICGPANYSIRRHEKAWNSRDKALSDFDHWRTRYFKAVNRVRTLSPEAEIDVVIARLEHLETTKDINKRLSKIVKSKSENKTREIKDLIVDVTDSDIVDLLNGERVHEIAPVTYNATLKIRETKKKILVMKNRIEAKENQKPIKFKGGSIYIENDRVIIAHDEKPERDIITDIKKHGFRWSPKMGNWCRKHTANARYDANMLLKNVFGGEI